MPPDEEQFLQKAVGDIRQQRPGITDDELHTLTKSALEHYRQLKPQQSTQLPQLPTLARDAITAEQGMKSLPSQDPRDVWQQVQDRGFRPETQQKIAGGLKKAITTIQQVQRAPSMLEKLGNAPVDALSNAAGAAKHIGKSGLEILGSAISTPGNYARAAIQPSKPGDEPLSLSAAYNGLGNQAEFSKRLDEKSAEPTSLANAPYQAFNKIADVNATANPLQNPIELLLRAGGLFSPKAEELANRQHAFVKEQSLGGATDPLSWLQIGQAGQQEQVAKQVERALGLSGKSENVEQAVKLAQRAIVTRKGPQVAKTLERIMKAAGADESSVSKVFGPNYTFAGQQGAEFAGVDLSAAANKVGLTKLGLPEQLGRRALETVKPGLRTIAGRVGGNSFERTFKSSELSKTTHKAINNAAETFADYKETVAPLMPADAKRRELLVKWMDRGAESSAQLNSDVAKQLNIDPVTFQPKDPADQKAIDALSAFFDRTGQKYKSAGLISELAANEQGHYIPRLWREEQKGIGAWFRRTFIEGDRANVSSTADRAAIADQHPLGVERPGFKAPTDPHQIVAEYVPPMERAKAQGQLDQIMKAAYNGKVPADVQKLSEKAFAGKNIRIVDGLMNLFKEQQLFGAGRFHLANLFEETSKTVSAGLISGGNDLGDASAIMKSTLPDTAVIVNTPARNYTAGEIRQAAKDAGYFHSSATADLTNPSKAFSEFANTSDKATSIGPVSRYGRRAKEQPIAAAAQAFKDVTNVGANRMGRKWAEGFDSRLKVAGLIGRLRQGDSIEQAVERVNSVHFDYTQQSPALRAVKKAVPFASFTANSVEHLPGVTARNPWLAAMQARGFQEASMGRQDSPPQYQAEAGQTIPIEGQSKDFINKMLTSLGGNPDPAYNYSYRPRGALLESMSQPAELASGNADPLLMMFGPLAQPLIERLSGKDFVSKKDQGPLEVNGSLPLVPAGTKGFAPQLQAGRDHATIAKYLAPLLGPYVPLLANYASEQAGSNQPPFGGAPYADDPRSKLILQLLSTLGFPLTQTDPSTRIRNESSTEPMKDAAKLPGQLKSDVRRAASRKK